jgi:hypothetical protein
MLPGLTVLGALALGLSAMQKKPSFLFDKKKCFN